MAVSGDILKQLKNKNTVFPRTKAENVLYATTSLTTISVKDKLDSLDDTIDDIVNTVSNSNNVTQEDNNVIGTVPIYNGNKTLTDSGFTIGTSVPSDALFTDTVYSNASDSVDGLLSRTMFTKINTNTSNITTLRSDVDNITEITNSDILTIVNS